jgi:hypothetical protein
MVEMAQVALLSLDTFIQPIQKLISRFIIILIMVQIRLVSSHPTEYFDRLPSVRRYKSAGIKNGPGNIVASLFGLCKASPVIPDFSGQIIGDTIIAYHDSPVTNSRRISSPTARNWQSYLSGEVSSVIGKLLSCPGSNFRTFGIDANAVRSLDFTKAFEMVVAPLSALPGWKDISSKITLETTRQDIANALLMDPGGIPREGLVFPEPTNVSSNIEADVFGGKIVRNGSV